ncbi:MAG: hypothetical protein K0U93_08370, partial [Gammaproteobacteria bacterium]|nr:hypothetical protein [Gammaproteobacteria bacterium]
MEQLSAFFRWWFSELGSLLPARLRAQPGRRLNTLRFQVHPRSVEVGEFSDGTLKKLAELPRGPKGELNAEPEFLHSLQTLLTRRFPVGRSVVEVGLPSGSALAREVELPLPAEENLRGVLGFEMERLTPFRVDDIYYAGQVIHRDTTTRKLNVGLLAVPRAQVDPILGLLPSDARGFLSDEAIVQQEGDGSVVVFRPTYIESAGRKGRLWALVAINVALIIALIAVPLWRQGQVLDELKREVRAATASAGEASAVQDRIDAVKREMVQISEVKASRPPAVETMEEISRLLPDSTWLSRF